MMSKHTWNYRIAMGKNPVDDLYYGAIHEVHYTNGVETAIAETPATFGADLCDAEEEVREQIIQALEMALKDIKAKTTFYPPKEWNVPGFNLKAKKQFKLDNITELENEN
jgi:hypothetical protein